MFDHKKFYICFIMFLINSTMASKSITCRDEANEAVDWFLLYKIPKLKDHPNPLVQSGEAYAYMTSRIHQDWILSKRSINSSHSIPGLTLAPLYNSSFSGISEDKLYVLYNDQPPEGNVSFTGGHTKGVVYADNTGGIWIIHSVPHYPPVLRSKQYSYPSTGLRNGQSYLCITAVSDQIDRIGSYLLYNEPHIFANSTPNKLQVEYPALAKAVSGKNVISPPWFHADSLTSSAGFTFNIFAKTPQFKKDLYSDWVSAALAVDLLVETWPNGPGRLNSSCHHTYRVENVAGVKVPAVNETFSAHKDHSKWAVSETLDDPWVCVGDINRASTQAERGGGTVCLRDATVWQAYYHSVTSVESCPLDIILS